MLFNESVFKEQRFFFTTGNEHFYVGKLGKQEAPGGDPVLQVKNVTAAYGNAVRVLNDDVVQMSRLSGSIIANVAEREWEEIERREALYRADRPVFSLDEILTYLAQNPDVQRLNQRFWGQTYVSAEAHSEPPPDRLLVKENPC